MDILKFFQEAGKLKKIKRAGWVLEGVKDSESVADHVFRTTLMTLILGKGAKDLDLFKAVKMAMIHDIGESQVGDLIVNEKLKDVLDKRAVNRAKKMLKGIGVTKEERRKLESEALEKLSELSGTNEIHLLWKEFEEGKTAEAKFVRQIDKLEMVMQALEYESESKQSKLDKYFSGPFGASNIDNPYLVEYVKKIIKLRPTK